LVNRGESLNNKIVKVAAKILIGVIAFLHLYIAWFEMFAWEVSGPRVFSSFPKDLFPATKSMAGNQGLYNGFLAVGLVWTFFIKDVIWSRKIGVFFLGCVAIAGVYGALTIEAKIVFIQTVPAVIAIGLLLLRKDLSGTNH